MAAEKDRSSTKVTEVDLLTGDDRRRLRGFDAIMTMTIIMTASLAKVTPRHRQQSLQSPAKAITTPTTFQETIQA